ncbi:macrophage mannose receptor 1-like [Sardina pilchardus]|uniref:macrophage mannose receptor 1-like n=1 Tax=Sardina pilchardus TaxID=27697 RepID=UPI002E150E5A
MPGPGRPSARPNESSRRRCADRESGITGGHRKLSAGLSSLSSSVPRQFHVVKEPKNWTEAQQYCREKFTDLATINDMTEMEKVKSMIHEAGAEEAWIGLKRGEWQWSLAKSDFHRENEAEFRNWDTNQPNENGGNSTHPYVLVTDGKNWTDAQRYCREKHTDLASVRSQAENNQINETIADSLDPQEDGGNRTAWIGLFRANWSEWSDGSSSSFRHWKAGEPNNLKGKEFCVATGGQWNDAECHHPKSFICYEDKLVLVRENKTWREALQYCREEHVDLVSVTSERVQHWVSRLAKGAATAHVWVGLLHSYGVGWYWVCGQTVCYSNWTQGHEPVESLQQGVGAVESREGQWVGNLNKTDQLNFICTTEAVTGWEGGGSGQS